MLFKVKRTIEEYKLFVKGERILIGVSGGADSIALLWILHQLAKDNQWDLHVAHVEHGLRGPESVSDMEFVRDFSKKLNVPFHVGQPEVKKYAHEHGLSKQVAAREVRYQFFLTTAKKIGSTKLALAHHADDQAETVLMRILRGTSISGLAGIPFRRKMDGIEIVRPLFFVFKEELAAYCRQENLSFRFDSTNALTHYLRNKIRLQLIPLLQTDYNENIKQALIRLGQIAADEDIYLDDQAKTLCKELVDHQTNDTFRVSIVRLQEVPLALQRRVIKLILYYLCGHTREWEAKHVEHVLDLLSNPNPSAKINLPNGVVVWREYQLIHFGKLPEGISVPKLNQQEFWIPDYGSEVLGEIVKFEIPELHIKGSMEVLEGAVFPKHPWEAVFDYNQLRGNNLLVRSRQAGDILRPIGMDGTKKIKEVFMEARVPVTQREQWPIWVLRDEVAWVTGIRRGQVATVLPTTHRTLRVQVERFQFYRG